MGVGRLCLRRYKQRRGGLRYSPPPPKGEPWPKPSREGPKPRGAPDVKTAGREPVQPMPAAGVSVPQG